MLAVASGGFQWELSLCYFFYSDWRVITFVFSYQLTKVFTSTVCWIRVCYPNVRMFLAIFYNSFMFVTLWSDFMKNKHIAEWALLSFLPWSSNRSWRTYYKTESHWRYSVIDGPLVSAEFAMCLLMLLNTKGITPGCNVGSTSNCATQYCQTVTRFLPSMLWLIDEWSLVYRSDGIYPPNTFDMTKTLYELCLSCLRSRLCFLQSHRMRVWTRVGINSPKAFAFSSYWWLSKYATCLLLRPSATSGL